MDTKKEIIREIARIWLSLSRIGALMELQGAKCGKCGKCGHQDSEIKKDARAVLLAAKAMGPMKKEAKPERLPDVPDWRDTEAAKQRDGAAQFAKDDKLTQIRLTVAAHHGKKLSKIIEAILADGTDLKTLASILGVNRARISEAKHGHARPGFKLIFTQVLGEGADPATSRTGRTGRTVAKDQAASKKSGKRGAK